MLHRISPITRALLSLIVVWILAAEPASAQRISLGPYLGAGISPATTFGGVTARFGGGFLQFAPGFDASFSDGFDRWQIDANVLYRFELENSNVRPYFGAGPVLADRPAEDLGIGANVVVGAGVSLGPIQPFFMSRLTVVQETSVGVMAGLLFTIPDQQQQQ